MSANYLKTPYRVAKRVKRIHLTPKTVKFLLNYGIIRIMVDLTKSTKGNNCGSTLTTLATFPASVKRITIDEWGEGTLTLAIPKSHLNQTTHLTNYTSKLLIVSVGISKRREKKRGQEG